MQVNKLAWIQILNEETAGIENYDYILYKKVTEHVEKCGAKFLMVEAPWLKLHETSTPGEHTIRSIRENHAWTRNYVIALVENMEAHRNGYFIDPELVTSEYLEMTYHGPEIVLRKNYLVNGEYDTEYVKIKNGYRIGNTKKGNTPIYVYGNSKAYSLGATEDQAISSFMQDMLPDYSVYNRGVRGIPITNACLAILDTDFNAGDIVILYDAVTGLHLSEKKRDHIRADLNVLDLRTTFHRPHNYEGDLFFDPGHTTPRGNYYIAELIAKAIGDIRTVWNHLTPKEEETFERIQAAHTRTALRYIDEDLPVYIDSLEPREGVSGAVVVNCNPFTLGHQHLIRYAASQVDTLYVFVVEEDASIFPFKDRIEMVKRGTADLDNIVVLPSGKYIISAITFPEYFTKSVQNKQEGCCQQGIADSRFDLEVFTYYIAPALNITKRFVGEEPFCQTTARYNKNMREIFPLGGIEFVEISRKTSTTDAIISATTVRAAIKENDIATLNTLLPETTMQVLLEKDYLRR